MGTLERGGRGAGWKGVREGDVKVGDSRHKGGGRAVGVLWQNDNVATATGLSGALVYEPHLDSILHRDLRTSL